MADPAQGTTLTDHARVREREASPSRFAIAGHPIHPMLIPFPIAFLVGGLGTDVVHAVTGSAFFADMSLWLIGAGVLTGIVAAVPGLVDLLTIAVARRTRAGKVHAIGNGVIVALAAANLLVRLVGDAHAAVVPWGLVLSAVVGAGLAVTGWYGGELSYRYMVGVDPVDEQVDRRETRPE